MNLQTWKKATIVANNIMISYEKKSKVVKIVLRKKISDDTLKDRISKALVQIKKG
mgnify:CR=1 FL=1